MSTVYSQIHNISEAVSRNIEAFTDHRETLSQNILAQLRNLVEGVAVLLKSQSLDTPFNYEAIKPSLYFVQGSAKYNFLGRFHKLLQISASHYTLE